jgi:hypothetical protein
MSLRYKSIQLAMERNSVINYQSRADHNESRRA